MMKPNLPSPDVTQQTDAFFHHFLSNLGRRGVMVLLIACVAFAAAFAQDAPSDRAARWNSYALPTSEFRRVVDETFGVILRVPASWKQETITHTRAEETSYRFIGPYATVLQISIEKIPDGLPLQSYTAQITQQLRNLPGSGDSFSVRQAEMAGLEAREISFDLPDENGAQTRRLIWCAVDGPVAVGVVFIETENHIAEIEPYLRAVIQSLTIYGNDRLPAFEATRSAAIKESKPARLDEAQSLVASINGLDASVRAAAIDKLVGLLASTPDVCIDVILDRRPIVRAAMVAAIARSKNHALDPFLVKGLHDQESFVAAQAAQSIALLPNVVALLRAETLSWLSTELLARAWPFLDRKAQVQILNEAFSQPPPPQVPTRLPKRSTGARAVNIEYSDPSAQLGLVTLLVDVPLEDFKLPLAAILKSQSDPLTVAALQVAYARREILPYGDLFKLVSSANFDIGRLAAKNLGDSAAGANIGQLEELANVLNGQTPGSVRAPTTDKPKSNDEGKAIAQELRVSIKKIRLRNDLLAANSEQKTKLISDAAKDAELVDWIWLRYLGWPDRPSPKIPSTLSVSPLGENAFPKQMTHYVAIPNPGSVIDKLGTSLNNIQMDSARAQANLVLILTGVGRGLGQLLNAPADAPVFSYSGIKSNAPMSFGSWIATGAPLGVLAAQRKAIVLHIADRDRFERSLAFYQRGIGSFSSFPDGVAIGARFMALFPAIFPAAANLMFQDLPRSTNPTILKYDFAGQTTVDDYPVKWFSARSVSSQGIIDNDVAYVAYMGDVAVLTPTLSSMREVLERINGGGATLDQNQQFKVSREAGGEAFYFSNFNELFNQLGAKNDAHIGESGALQISNNSWESSYRLTFDEDGWSKPLVSFKPEDLSAPRELLPRSTVAYYFMKVNGGEALRSWGAAFTPAEMKSIADVWAVDFQKEVLPEFDSECGVALLDLPELAKDDWKTHWVLFFKLKSDRLQRALNAGQLLKGTTVNQVGLVNAGPSPLYLTVNNGFLLVSDARESFKLLDQKEKLVASSDFAKALKRSPDNVIAFGGYNLETTDAIGGANPDSVKAQQANLILSLVRAFHSPSFYATINGNNVEARSSISMDREGRYSVGELQALAANSEPTFAILRPRGLPIEDQARLKGLKLRIQARVNGEIDRIAEDLASKFQTIEARSEQELQVRIMPRRAEPTQRLQLPITAPEVAAFLTPAKGAAAEDTSVEKKAREIAGNDRDAWSVARKLADWTYKNLTWRRVDYADAAQTLATKEADCYEFSKLYVAMARSVGLPARVVSGMAYGDGSFGGHAWVEVYVGDWIEIDPTWGTSFVDATHIKDSTGALMTYAALNLVQLEVLDTPHGVAEYEKDAGALTRKLCEDLSDGRSDSLRSSLEISAITDELVGPGSWAAMTDKERDQISGSYSRIVTSLTNWLGNNSPRSSVRFLNIKIADNRAVAFVMASTNFSDDFLKLTLIKSGERWVVVEVLEADTGLKMVSENLQPTIAEIRDRRSGAPRGSLAQTEFARVMVTMKRDNQAALLLIEKLLKDNPRSQSLRYLKSLALANLAKFDEAAKLWAELADEQPTVAPALRKLADHYSGSEQLTERNKAVDLFKRYISLEPDDPRARSGLAQVYELEGNVKAAEIEYRAAIEGDESNSMIYLDLAQLYAQQKRFDEAITTLKEAEKHTNDKDDLFGELMGRFWLGDNVDVPEALAASEAELMAHSASANLNLARIRLSNNHYREALPLLRKAAALDSKSSEPYDMLAEAFRKLHEWTAAVNAADTALRLSADDSEAHYQRACALARLGRRTEAMVELKRAVELDEDLTESLEEEEDLKPLAALPEFKKLLPKSGQP